MRVPECVCVRVCVGIRKRDAECMCVCVCVCVRERERERQRDREWLNEWVRVCTCGNVCQQCNGGRYQLVMEANWNREQLATLLSASHRPNASGLRWSGYQLLSWTHVFRHYVTVCVERKGLGSTTLSKTSLVGSVVWSFNRTGVKRFLQQRHVKVSYLFQWLAQSASAWRDRKELIHK